MVLLRAEQEDGGAKKVHCEADLDTSQAICEELELKTSYPGQVGFARKYSALRVLTSAVVLGEPVAVEDKQPTEEVPVRTGSQPHSMFDMGTAFCIVFIGMVIVLLILFVLHHDAVVHGDQARVAQLNISPGDEVYYWSGRNQDWRGPATVIRFQENDAILSHGSVILRCIRGHLRVAVPIEYAVWNVPDLGLSLDPAGLDRADASEAMDDQSEDDEMDASDETDDLGIGECFFCGSRGIPGNYCDNCEDTGFIYE